MKKIDIKEWKEFYPSDFFKLQPISLKLDKSQIYPKGSIKVYSSTTENNGVAGYCDEKPTFIVNEDIKMYLIFGDHTKSMFIAEESFCVMDNVKVLVPKIQNKNLIRFICTIWQKNIPNLGYARHWNVAKNVKIKLPISNSAEPDWNYMESYIKNIEFKAHNRLKNIYNINNQDYSNKINTVSWKEFYIGDLFDIKKPAVYHTRQVNENENGMPYVVRSKFNNGIKYRANIKPNEKYRTTNPANVISFGSENASFFYQNEEWISGRDIYYIDTKKYSPEVCFFLISCLGTITSKYNYNNGLFPDLLRKEKIKLPIVEDGEPDWNYMEEFMVNINKKMQSKLKYLF